ncbi:DNA primase [Aquabacterium sp. OR-4]|uniref:DNA primase n=1 Tax=Aquabacterium sp. OR-4 TaxID=2978127 RepID=UPI0021B1E076|nr:DNA primase [Aquabacterium sp. OR-4]MDT7835410.1 DNA primase [Aquabacterium sp. OR-4]
MLPQGFIQELLSRVDIVEVVGRHVELKKAGINHKGLCPFHGEKSPSFIVSPSRQTYHCFGCGAHGDAIRFLTEQGGLGFMDAVRELAQQTGVNVPDDRSTPAEREREQAEKAQRASLSDVLAKAGAHYRTSLKSNPRAVDYLKRRGLTGQVAAQFGLGYAPDGWRTLASVFARYDDPLLTESGLVIVSGDEGEDQKRYDRFRDRIMFPIRSVKGEVIGFGGRVLDQGEPKYLNSPETPVFHKGRELYGLYEARQALRSKGYALVVEGYMDVVALAQWGYANAVATLGTACTAEHVVKLFRFTEAVVFSFDGDAAGRRAAARALEAALPHASDTRSIRFLFLPTEHDPDSYIRELGPEAFEQALAGAVPLSTQLIAHAGADCDLATPEGRSKMLTQAGPLVALLPEGLLREQLVAELAQRGGLPVESLQAHWSRRAQGRAGRAEPARREAAPSGAPADDGAPWPSDAADARDGNPPDSGRRRWKERDGEGGSGGDGWRKRRDRPFVPAMGGRRTPPQTATLLDRAAWLLARHAGLWLELSGEVHDFLAGQGTPYNSFFAALERAVHEHGGIALPALLDEMRRGDDADVLAPLLDRMTGFHEVDDDEDPAALFDSVLRRLRQRAVAEELEWLIESGELSEAATERRRELIELTKQLKAAPAAAGASASSPRR